MLKPSSMQVPDEIGSSAAPNASRRETGRWRLRIVEPDGGEWAELLARSDHLLFHEPLWAEITRIGFQAQTYAVVFEHGGSVKSGVMGFAFRSLWSRLLYLGFPYGGIVGEAPPGKDLAGLLRRAASDLDVSRIRLTDCPNLRPVDPEGFDHVETRTHILDLRLGDYDALWRGFKKRVRRDVRRAERSGVQVENGASHEAVGEFYDLYLESMRRNHAVPKYDLALVSAIFEKLNPLGRCAILIARREGVAIAGALIVDSPTASHYLMGGSSTAGLQYCPNDLLLHCAIRRAVALGLDGFDFLPSGVGDDALERFKSKWGAEVHPVAVHSVVTQPARMAAWNLAYRAAESRLGTTLLGLVRGRADLRRQVAAAGHE